MTRTTRVIRAALVDFALAVAGLLTIKHTLGIDWDTGDVAGVAAGLVLIAIAFRPWT